jgi:hypothetical protein
MAFVLDRYVNRWQQWVEHRTRWVLLYDSQRLIMQTGQRMANIVHTLTRTTPDSSNRIIGMSWDRVGGLELEEPDVMI